MEATATGPRCMRATCASSSGPAAAVIAHVESRFSNFGGKT